MKTMIVLLGMLISIPSAFADGWTSRVSCADGAFVVDGYHTYETGFTAHQAVIRHSQAISHFSSLAQMELSTSRGELVIGVNSRTFDGTFSSRIAQASAGPNASPVQNFYSMNGRWLDGGRYEVSLTVLQYYPGASYRAPTYLGNWVFEGCRSVN
jgi:hypothetical protein